MYPLPPSPSPSDSDLVNTYRRTFKQCTYERKLGSNELSYYLPSRAEGVNDMYHHLGMKAPRRLMNHGRASLVWATLRLRHPLLCSRIEMHNYDDVRFVFTPPSSPESALRQAEEQLEWKYTSKDDLIDTYLNGPRTLSNDRLSYLIISCSSSSESYPSPPLTPAIDTDTAEKNLAEETLNFEWVMCAMHCIGDGMALHSFANDFFCLLGSAKSDQELHGILVAEWEKRWGTVVSDGFSALPPSFEVSLPTVKGRFQRAAGRIDFERSLDKHVGGHMFPRRKNGARHTVVSTLSFDEALTKAMLKKCKSQGVSIAGALFAACNIAWARVSPREHHVLPMMMYAAMNVRPCLLPRPMNDSYWFLAVGYFNVVLPSFIPSSCDVSKTFWHRARLVKDQITQAAKTPMLASRTREMALKRGHQSQVWAREDDGKAAGTSTHLPPKNQTSTDGAKAAPRAPSAALLGLSMLGNLDAMYAHKSFPSIELNCLTTGSRQRNGGMLLFGYTFAGKLWVSLGYDENSFEPKPLAMFWGGVKDAMNEFVA